MGQTSRFFRTASAAAVAVLGSFLAGPHAEATVVSSLNGVVVPMPAVNYFGTGPQVFDGGEVTWTSTAANATFGYTSPYGFYVNGEWDGALGPMAGLGTSFFTNSVTDTMTFTFTTPVSAAGGFVNYSPFYLVDDSLPATVVSVYSPTHVLLESTTLSFLTGDATNSGQFVGFVDVGPIGSLTLSDNYVGLVGLTLPAPESSTWAMMLIGFAGLGFAGYRKAKTGPQAAGRWGHAGP
jgi:hypothetical protein